MNVLFSVQFALSVLILVVVFGRARMSTERGHLGSGSKAGVNFAALRGYKAHARCKSAILILLVVALSFCSCGSVIEDTLATGNCGGTEVNLGIVIHPEDLDEVWINEAKKLGVDTISVHPVDYDGKDSISDFINSFSTDDFKQNVDKAIESDIRIEYEFHAMRFLLPRSLFAEHPEWFRMNSEGERNADYNCCVSSKIALETIAANAADAVNQLYYGGLEPNRFYFWTDDGVSASCCCTECSKYSAADQQMMIANAICERIREDRPEAEVAFLAYADCFAETPSEVRPAPGVFLEIAPFSRDHNLSLTDEKNASQAEMIRRYVEYFGAEKTKVLEYWLDNSMFSGWEKPEKEFILNEQVLKEDFRWYRELGINDITTFACYLGESYRKLYGIPDIGEYGNCQ